MKHRLLFLLSLMAAVVASGPTDALAQGPATDLITLINGENFLSDASTRYFNAANCANPSGVTFEERIVSSTAVTQVWLWVGIFNGGCEEETNRTDVTATRCGEVSSNPQTVDPNNLVVGRTLADLISTGIVDCDNGALEGEPYELFGFRQAPGGQDVLPENFGIAQFTVDVVAPNPPNVTNTTAGFGQQFTINWSAITDEIQLYKFYQSRDGDPATAVVIEGVTADLSAQSKAISATDLGLGIGETTTLFMTAIDMASPILGDGNESDLSNGWEVTAAETGGFCQADPEACAGCSLAPENLASRGSGTMAWLLGLVFAIAIGRRLRR